MPLQIDPNFTAKNHIFKIIIIIIIIIIDVTGK